jgi:uncharacterized membrane-anchored protein
MPFTSGQLSRRFPQPVAAKVPEITALFWIIKVLTTGVGESASDWLAARNILLAGAIGFLGFVVAMWWQFRATSYRPVTYWTAVLMVAVFGTMAADGLHKKVGVPYLGTTVLYGVALTVIFLLWHRSEHTLSIHTIVTRRRETFYWLAVLATFALGTAVGDVTAFTFHLGFSASIVLFGVAISIPGILYWRGVLGGVPAFWAAYVLTRPLGASIADYLGKGTHLSGLGLGDGTVTVVGLVLIAILVGYLELTQYGIQPAMATATSVPTGWSAATAATATNLPTATIPATPATPATAVTAAAAPVESSQARPSTAPNRLIVSGDAEA